MARDLNVREMIAAELRRDRRATPEDLHFLAGRIDPELEELSLTEFKARYLPDDGRSAGSGSSRRKPSRKARGATTRTRGRARKRGSATKPGPPAPRADASMATAPPTATNGVAVADAEHVRAVLNRFARDLAAAEDPLEVISVMSGLDRYVHEIVAGG